MRLALNDVASMIKVAGADLSDLHDEIKRVKGKLERGEGTRSELQEELLKALYEREKILCEREKILCEREKTLIKDRENLLKKQSEQEANRVGVGMFPPLLTINSLYRVFIFQMQI